MNNLSPHKTILNKFEITNRLAAKKSLLCCGNWLFAQV